ncbi:sigma-54-dependent transcriptional regulator [candidate division CSSED10-310 bacterium]|uniref:Sigma-54-dependent transcriptional regulator n=1 Tax=candidate division CSSED10-310 bacterium TaxID=2855610 RepID=A0ABV6YVF6_UNCC1
MAHENILVVDDEESICHILSVILAKESYSVDTALTGAAALEKITATQYDLILCDIRMPDMDGISLLKKTIQLHPDQMVIMMTAFGTIESAVEAMRDGAYDYLSKPIKAKEIILHVRKALERKKLFTENIYLREVVQEKFSFNKIIGKSPHIIKIFDTIKKIAPYKSTVLITGESGTGKELIAKAIHYNSNRRNNPFIAVNCGAIPAELLESELFGHVRGSFTGAHTTKRGLFVDAHGGTLFLDEIADIPENSQVKLLRALQEDEIRAVGSNQTVKIDVRIISATEQILENKIKENTFRESLYYRLNVVHIELPPLRKREIDIPLIAQHFITRWCRKNDKAPLAISPSAMESLLNYHWPGNVRELENVIERAVLMADDCTIMKENLPPKLFQKKSDIHISLPDDQFDLKKIHKDVSALVERRLILQALRKSKYNRTHAAKLLNISHRSLLYKIKEYKLECEEEVS